MINEMNENVFSNPHKIFKTNQTNMYFKFLNEKTFLLIYFCALNELLKKYQYFMLHHRNIETFERQQSKSSFISIRNM